MATEQAPHSEELAQERHSLLQRCGQYLKQSGMPFSYQLEDLKKIYFALDRGDAMEILSKN